jgi:hypothetical protein
VANRENMEKVRSRFVAVVRKKNKKFIAQTTILHRGFNEETAHSRSCKFVTKQQARVGIHTPKERNKRTSNSALLKIHELTLHESKN